MVSSVPTDLQSIKRHRQLRDSSTLGDRRTEPVYEFSNGVLKVKNEETPQADQPDNSEDKRPVHLAYIPGKNSKSYQPNRRGGTKPDSVRFETKVETLEYEGTTKILNRRRGPSRIEGN